MLVIRIKVLTFGGELSVRIIPIQYMLTRNRNTAKEIEA
jgi:hypothetical protein